MIEKMYYVYILKSLKNQKFYVGVSGDPEKRAAEHNLGVVKGSKNNLPYELVYKEEYNAPKEAKQREYYIKSQKSHRFIEDLISS